MQRSAESPAGNGSTAGRTDQRRRTVMALSTTEMASRRRRVSRAVTGAALALALFVSACSGTPTLEAPATRSTMPPSLGAEVYQSRMDVEDRRVQVKLSNNGDGDVVVERMTLVSSDFDAPMVYRKSGSVVRPGLATDMPVVLSDPNCQEAVGRHTVQVQYRLEDDSTGTVDLTAVDQGGAITALHSQECFAADVSRVALLSLRDGPRVETRGGMLVAELTVDVKSVAAGRGELQIRHVGGTTLFQHLDPTTLEQLPQGLALDVRAPDAGSRSFHLALVPSRCDAHAIAEDKQGTRFRVLVELDGTEGQVPLVASDAVKVALYEFVREACQ